MKKTINKTTKLIDYIKKETDINLKQFKKLLLSNKILVNNKVVQNTNHLILSGDLLEIVFNNDESISNKKQQTNIYNQIKIIHEDDYFIVIFKPSGLLVHDNNFDSEVNLTNWDYIKNIKLERSGICHRLDKYTSGLLIIAKTEEVLESFKTMFFENNIIRKYYAIVLNHFHESNNWYLIETLIGRKHNNDIRLTVNNPKNAKEAKTKFRLIRNLKNGCSLVECELLTGRTHQIRVHMNHINHPVLNDPLYGVSLKDDDYEQYLVAYYLKFNHPITFVPIELKIDLDDKFNNKLTELENE